MDTPTTDGASPLFSPLAIRGVTLANRVVVSPMCTYSARDGVPDDFHLVHYGKFAMGGAGLVFVEATAVSPEGRITNGCLGLWNEAQAEGHRRVVRSLKAYGAVPALQLAHAGRKASAQRAFEGNGPLTADNLARGDQSWEPLGPSEHPFADGWLAPRKLDRAGMDVLRDAFVAAARRALAVGYEVIELHMAHGYLLQSFLSPLANRREDEYGGSLENRMRFPLEVAEAVRAAIPDGVPLFARVSSTDWIEGGWEVDDTIVLAGALGAAGVDVVDCSSGGNSLAGATNSSIARAPGYQVPFARRVRREAGVMTQAVGLIRSPQMAEALVEEGAADLVALGRQMLYDPFWPHHAAEELGVTDKFENWPVPYGWWLEKWARGLRSMDETPRSARFDPAAWSADADTAHGVGAR